LGGRYPQGYPVGEVLSVEQEPGDWFATIKIKPTAAIGSIHNVLLVWAHEEK
jgi:rod shape-determining protein MreC